MPRGFYGIGVERVKTNHNVGTLWRSAYNFGAEFLFTIAGRYRPQASDTFNTPKNVPLFRYADIEQFYGTIPYDCKLVGVELVEGATSLPEYQHPDRCIYLLGPEDGGLSKEAQRRCHDLIVIPTHLCLNVAVAGAVVMYDRCTKRGKA